MKNSLIDKVALILVAAVILSVAALNLFQTERPTISETENRVLATWPELNAGALLDGSYFSDIAAFFSDTFIGRDGMVTMSKKMDLLKSLSLIYDKGGITVVVDPNATQPPSTLETLETLPPLPTLPPKSPTSSTIKPSTPPASSSSTVPTFPEVDPITLTETSYTITAGATMTLAAIVGEGYGELGWYSSDSTIATVTDNGNGTATVKGLAAGTATIFAQVNNGTETKEASCSITVKAIQQDQPKPDADFLPNGLIIYNGAVYSQSYFVSSYAPNFAALYDRYAKLFPNARVTVMPAPLSTITITDPNISKKLSSQTNVLNKMEASMPDSVNFVNLANIFKEHSDEYLFFKSDHHWTHLGAYYAYYEFARSVGLTPRPLTDFQVRTQTEKYIGSMYNYTGDERVKSFYDTINVYVPSKPCTMTIHAKDGVFTYKYVINPKGTTYTCFIRGDHGYTVINVPDNPQDKIAVVIKDSFGNAFVPYLTEHYGNIYVIDPRHVTIDMVEQFGNMNVTDIIFAINNQSGNSSTWYKLFLKMVD